MHCDSAFMHSLGFIPGSVNHISRTRMESLLGNLPTTAMVAGGGSANTCRIASMLGAECAFSGAVGCDGYGEWYQRKLENDGVKAALQRYPAEGTGVFCTFIHEHGKRSLVVAPGAATHLDASALEPWLFRHGGILHAEGFLANDPEILSGLFRRGIDAGMRCSLDLGSEGLVRSRRKEFWSLIIRYCDTVFADEAEFAALTGNGQRDDAAISLPEDTLFVVKMGAKGARCIRDGMITEGSTRALAAFDETGAGDAFAAAFLCAAAAGLDDTECLRRANNLAGQTVLVPGAGLSASQARASFFDREGELEHCAENSPKT